MLKAAPFYQQQVGGSMLYGSAFHTINHSMSWRSRKMMAASTSFFMEALPSACLPRRATKSHSPTLAGTALRALSKKSQKEQLSMRLSCGTTESSSSSAIVR